MENNMNWMDVSETNSRFITLIKTVKKTKVLFTHVFTALLEEVNKSWDLPFNWRITLIDKSEDFDKEVLRETFYLNINANNIGTAQLRADEYVAKYLESV
jgi:hypothetical protein